MICDYCERELPADAVIDLDERGRPTQLACSECKEAIRVGREVLERLASAREERRRPLIDRFEDHLARVFPPARIH